MKKLLPLAIASMFVLSGSVFAAETTAAPVKTEAQPVSATQHKAGEKAKQHKKHVTAKSETKQPAKDAAAK
ncbi:hypothetical protein [Pragia fontium]|uniref:Acid shock protein n=1 Tax=Pragia fontium DSM 5563 = ATCC 49100 TaxID=1122977 RepID=A0AAJ4W8Z5_9GAMM|nr:hypothetical protein [Pragia fontium]SFC33456.1 hypothetical protein SAMN02745723_102105 [Pragia fontium DSM 5563 = ATCC 49100]SUB81914.1 Uncharacterised protein [Pragia fontium]VEJ54489.1 Uncharacterised protein [Pragia fontium]